MGFGYKYVYETVRHYTDRTIARALRRRKIQPRVLTVTEYKHFLDRMPTMTPYTRRPAPPAAHGNTTHPHPHITALHPWTDMPTPAAEPAARHRARNTPMDPVARDAAYRQQRGGGPKRTPRQKRRYDQKLKPYQERVIAAEVVNAQVEAVANFAERIGKRMLPWQRRVARDVFERGTER